MEELFCIGCGAPIQTENKEGLGYTPQSALEKGLETGEVYCQRCFRLRHYNEITDVHLTDDDFLKLLHEVGDSDALSGQCSGYFLTLMDPLSLAYRAL